MPTFNRDNHLSPDLILIDGMSGTGKTMIMRFVDALERTNAPCFDYVLEQLIISGAFGKIESDALTTLLSLHLDQLFYDQSIAREVNFRTRDLSSVLRSTKRSSYLRRLFLSDQEFSFTQDLKDRSSLIIVVHQLLDTLLLLNQVYKGKVKQILCVRHPYYLFEHWLSYVNFFGTNPRDFTITIDDHGIPWFIEPNDGHFWNLSKEDKAAECIINLLSKQEKLINDSKSLLILDFENFVLHPSEYITSIESFCERKFGDIGRILKKENLPRKHINESRDLAIYRKYGSNKLSTTKSHLEHYEELRKSIQESLMPSTFQRLENSARQYESRFGLWFE